jgi:hypothetical protein
MLTGSTTVAAQAYTVTIGGGGGGAATAAGGEIQGANGGNSLFGAITAVGGGGGGSYGTPNGQSGGSGGGGGLGVGGPGTAGQGNNGGGDSRSGGGGAGSVGSNHSAAPSGGPGGAGVSSSISGASVFYAGGGGGAWPDADAGGVGGSGGGGHGGTSSLTSGSSNTGGGGGGGGADTSGMAGGSGIVIIRYLTPSPTGTLTPAFSSCLISAGNSSCNINFSWDTANPVSTSAITKPTNVTVTTGNSGTNVPFIIKYNTETFYLYHNAVLLAQSTVTSSCASGTTWNGGICASDAGGGATVTCFEAKPNPIVTISLSPASISTGRSSTLTWSSTNTTSCTASGGWSGAQALSGSQLFTPASTTVYTITCDGVSASATLTIKKRPTFKEN